MNKPYRSKRNSLIITLILVLFGSALYLLVGNISFNSIISSISEKDTHPKKLVDQGFQDASFEGNGKWYGLCTKNSIRSVADFRETVSNDRVLRSHYADFRWENAQMGRLEKATWAYVYYRKDDTIFRKHKPIVLAAGDEYITDGNVRVRTTCCNRYAAGPPESELDADPAAGPPESEPPAIIPSPEPIPDPSPIRHVERPPIHDPNIVPPPVISIGPDPIRWVKKHKKTPPDDPGSEDNPDPDPIIDSSPDPIVDPVPEPERVPEPSTIFLLGIGIVYFLVLLFIYRKNNLRIG